MAKAARPTERARRSQFGVEDGPVIYSGADRSRRRSCAQRLHECQRHRQRRGHLENATVGDETKEAGERRVKQADGFRAAQRGLKPRARLVVKRDILPLRVHEDVDIRQQHRSQDNCESLPGSSSRER
jgi:hypothetical protein